MNFFIRVRREGELGQGDPHPFMAEMNMEDMTCKKGGSARFLCLVFLFVPALFFVARFSSSVCLFSRFSLVFGRATPTVCRTMRASGVWDLRLLRERFFHFHQIRLSPRLEPIVRPAIPGALAFFLFTTSCYGSDTPDACVADAYAHYIHALGYVRISSS